MRSHGHKVKNILVHVKSDYAAELSAGRAKKWCSENLIQTVHSVPHVPDDNKLIETYVKLVKKLARVAAFESGVPADFWFWFCQIACHVINVSPQDTTNTTPYESAFGRPPSVHVLRVPGCLVFFKNYTSNKQSFLCPKAKAGVFVGYDQLSRSYKVYHLDTKRTVLTDECRFFEDMLPFKDTKLCQTMQLSAEPA